MSAALIQRFAAFLAPLTAGRVNIAVTAVYQSKVSYVYIFFLKHLIPFYWQMRHCIFLEFELWGGRPLMPNGKVTDIISLLSVLGWFSNCH